MDINFDINDFIYPYFVTNGKNKQQWVKSFPGVLRFSSDRLIKDIAESRKLGLNKILLFGIPASKDNIGTSAYQNNNIVASAIKEIKNRFPDLVVMADVCLCAYTDHGHCGMLNKDQRLIDNRATLETLSAAALSYASAGADWVAPSAMAKSQVSAIRKALDDNGFKNTKIMGYSAKFASNFYGPFRNAVDSAPRFGDRTGYQLNYEDREAATKEITADIKEGADMVMVKPALSYLDIIREAKNKFNFPLAAYNVSGEYAFVKYGARMGWWNEKGMVREIVASIKRAGADKIISYHAKDIAKWLKEKD